MLNFGGLMLAAPPTTEGMKWRTDKLTGRGKLTGSRMADRLAGRRFQDGSNNFPNEPVYVQASNLITEPLFDL